MNEFSSEKEGLEARANLLTILALANDALYLEHIERVREREKQRLYDEIVVAGVVPDKYSCDAFKLAFPELAHLVE